MANRFSDWVRTLPGFDDPRKGPAHSFRHWWKVAAVKAGIADSLADRVQGHTSTSAADGYRREIPLATLAEAVARVRIPNAARKSVEAVLTEADITEAPSMPVAHEAAEVEAQGG